MSSHKEQFLELKVTRGPQAGASMLLTASSSYRVGSDPTDDNDVLFRAVDADFSLSLDTTPGGESIRAEYGDISIGSKKIKVGENVAVKRGDKISVANLSFDLIQCETESAEIKDKPVSGLTMFVGGLLLTGGSALAIVGTSKTPEAELSLIHI